MIYKSPEDFIGKWIKYQSPDREYSFQVDGYKWIGNLGYDIYTIYGTTSDNTESEFNISFDELKYIKIISE